jgi:hypothetical protein
MKRKGTFGVKQNRIWLLALGGIALLSLAAMLLISMNQKQGDRVELYQNGVLVETLPLNKDAQRKIDAEHGGYNLIRIQDGQVSVTEASCPDQVCVRHGHTKQTADPIVCLPNRLEVRVVYEKSHGLDGVSS